MGDLTAAELRDLRQRLDRERAAVNEEREQLEYGARRVQDRLRELTQIDYRLRDLDYQVGRKIIDIQRLPRGARLPVDVPPQPLYNTHRRLAVMARGF